MGLEKLNTTTGTIVLQPLSKGEEIRIGDCVGFAHNPRAS